jgi:hypothetical protein
LETEQVRTPLPVWFVLQFLVLFSRMAFGMYGIDACLYPENFSTWLADNQGNIDIANNAGCVWGSGSTFNLTACILYLGSGLVLCCAPQPDPICR